ncbi:helix-turn-helix transcriptional regulator [Massilia kyonggiensis]|nr:helix-turn-helix domain-containing protein [Massilia kyonggiensis]
MANFGKRLKAARMAAGLSQERLGVEAGIQEESASARMNRYEKGTRAPAVEIVERVAKVLNAPVSYFYSQDDDEAKLLLAFHRMPANRRKELLKFALTDPGV